MKLFLYEEMLQRAGKVDFQHVRRHIGVRYFPFTSVCPDYKFMFKY